MTTAWDDLAAENARLRKELEEREMTFYRGMSAGSSGGSTEGWEPPPLVAQGQLVCVSKERWAELEHQAAEYRAAIRAYILDMDDDPSAPMHDNHGIDEEESDACPLCQWRKVKHAAAIARATQEPA
jgi:hypothetical protein